MAVMSTPHCEEGKQSALSQRRLDPWVAGEDGFDLKFPSHSRFLDFLCFDPCGEVSGPDCPMGAPSRTVPFVLLLSFPVRTADCPLGSPLEP